jgi:Fur family ferric uptake transcriptional regulator
MAHEVEHRTLARFLEEHSLKHTKQREAILDVFLEVEGHITSDDLYQQVRAVHPQIGYDGLTRYEIAHEHHDHLVCVRCGKIIEFECEMIESAQERIAATYHFRVLRHRHELYGHCEECQDAQRQ